MHRAKGRAEVMKLHGGPGNDICVWLEQNYAALAERLMAEAPTIQRLEAIKGAINKVP